jgi:hypothetical protein
VHRKKERNNIKKEREKNKEKEKERKRKRKAPRVSSNKKEKSIF